MATVTDTSVQEEKLSCQTAGETDNTHSGHSSNDSAWETDPRIVFCVLGILLFVSMVFEFFTGASFCAWLRMNNVWADCFIGALAPFFHADSVLKVAETIGVCSILIAWIYASLDKVELGICYEELVRKKLRGYHYYVAVHFVCVLLCLWLCKAEMVAASVVALCGVACTSCLQWKVLNSVVLSSAHRRELAMSVWRSRVKESAQNAAESKKLALNMISVIAGKGSTETLPLQREFITVVKNYVKQCRTEDVDGGLERAVEDAAWFWDRLLGGAGKSEQIYRARGLFLCCDGDGDDYGAISAGYVLWLMNDTIMRGEQANKSPEKALDEVRNSLGILARGKIERDMPDLLRDWHMIFAMTFYQYVFRRTIVSNSQKLQELWDRQPGSCSERDEKLLRATSEIHFSEFDEQIFSAIIHLMWKNGTSQEEGQ